MATLGTQRSGGVVDTRKGPKVGDRAPELVVETPAGRASIFNLAARHGMLVLVSVDSYRYHPG